MATTDSSFSLFTSLRYDVTLKQVPAMSLPHAGWNFDGDSSLYMLDFHRDRLLRAAIHWQWTKAIANLSGDKALSKLAQTAQEVCSASGKKPLRLRIIVDSSGDIQYQIFDTPELPLQNLFPASLTPPGATPGANEPRVPPCLTLVVDDVAMPRSEFTHFKTTRRAIYEAARQRAGIGPHQLKEVLLVSPDGDNGPVVIEGSTTTPYFWRSGGWVTPPVSPYFSWHDGSGGQDGTSRRWALERFASLRYAELLLSLTWATASTGAQGLGD